MIAIYDRPVGAEVAVMIEGAWGPSTVGKVYCEGVITQLPLSFSAMSPTGPSVARFTPVTQGLHTVVLQDGSIAFHVDVVPRSSQTYLRNIEDEALGSWVWDRVNGTLQMLRQDGSVLADFAVVDKQTESSRERLL